MGLPTVSDWCDELEKRECALCLMDGCVDGELDLVLAIFTLTAYGGMTLGEMRKNFCDDHQRDYDTAREEWDKR